MAYFTFVALISCLQWSVIASQTDDLFFPPCDNSNIDVQKCNEKHDKFLANFYQGPHFEKAVATLEQVAAQPYKNCSAGIPFTVDGKITTTRMRDYCQWFTKDSNGKQQKNVFLSYNSAFLSYLCDYETQRLNFDNDLVSILKSNMSTISITSCNMLDDEKDIQLDLPENFIECLQRLPQTGWLEKGTIGGSFQKLPIDIQYHIVDQKLTVDKIQINDAKFTSAMSIKSCEGDKGFKAICNCFQSSKMYDTAAQALVGTLLSCIKHDPEIVSFLENTVCTDD